MADNQDQEDVNSNTVLPSLIPDKFSPVLGENNLPVELKTSQDEELGVDIEEQKKNQSKNTNEWVYRGINPASSSVVLPDSDKINVLANSGEENGNETVTGLAESSTAWRRVTAAVEAPLQEEMPIWDQMSFSDDPDSSSVDPIQLAKYEAGLRHCLMLPEGDSISENHGLSISNTAEVDKLEDNPDTKSNKRKIDEINHQPPSDDAEETVLEPLNKSRLEMKNTEQFHSPNNNSKMPMMNNKNKKEKWKRRKLSDLEIAESFPTQEPAKGEESSGYKHKCTDCDAIFKSPQALGGHRARSHTKRNREYKCTDCDAIFKSQQALAGHSASHTKPNRVYKCTHCPATFKSPQALGGHMGSHRKRKVVIHDTDKSSSDSATPAKPRVKRS